MAIHYNILNKEIYYIYNIKIKTLGGNRTCIFGFGNKMTMESKQNFPPPGNY